MGDGDDTVHGDGHESGEAEGQGEAGAPPRREHHARHQHEEQPLVAGRGEQGRQPEQGRARRHRSERADEEQRDRGVQEMFLPHEHEGRNRREDHHRDEGEPPRCRAHAAVTQHAVGHHQQPGGEDDVEREGQHVARAEKREDAG